VRLKSLPAPDWLELPAPTVCLLTDDGSATTAQLANTLAQKGSAVVVLSFPPTLVSNQLPLPEGVARVELTDLSEAHLQKQLATLMTIHGAIDTFIHLHPRSPLKPGVEGFYPEADKAILQQVFLLAKHLKPSLTAAAQASRSSFLTTAQLDGAFGLTRQGDFSAIAAGVFGLTKTLVHEWPAVFCRAIDFSPELSTEQIVSAILSELHDPNLAITEVGYGRSGRTTLTC
jgi:NAD(P)-dependent dehydrogenase (short-subunit alcohol dehydrogenase family)